MEPKEFIKDVEASFEDYSIETLLLIAPIKTAQVAARSSALCTLPSIE
jgi:hypothetical protein